MLFYTHLTFSILVGIFALDYLSVGNKILFFLLMALFGILPDMDKSNSKIGKKLGIISQLINFIFGHRTFFHSFLFILPVYLIFSVFSEILAIPFLLGMASHLVLDALTPKGIVPFYPLKLRVKGWLKTGKLGEKMLFLLILVVVLFKLTTGHS